MKMTVWLILQFWETCRQVCLLLWAFSRLSVFSHYQFAFSDGKEGYTSQHPNVLFGSRRPSIRRESALAFCTNVSVNSKPDDPPGEFFLKGRIPHPSFTKKMRNPDPWGRKIVLKPHPRAIISKNPAEKNKTGDRNYEKQYCLEILTQ